jgi:hypothetical protein
MMIGAVIGTIAIVLVVIVVGLLVDRKVTVLPKPKLEVAKLDKPSAVHLPGEAPATALRVRGAQLDKLRTSQRCPSCRTAMEAGADDTVRYDDADLLVLHFTCTRCDARRTLYVVPREGN